jgi:hypothetical protein
MDPLTLVIVKTIASTCLKFYLGSLMGGGGLNYSKAELGYKVPKWYMNPGRSTSVFYSYGTSVKGDEFESITDAREKAIAQMVKHIRLGNQRMVQEKIKFNRSNVKQLRLVDLFVRDAGLEDFILMNATVKKKQLVRVKQPEEDMRAFVSLALKTNAYLEYQENSIHTLKSRIMHQKTDDILAEVDAEARAYDAPFEGEAVSKVTDAPPEESTPPTFQIPPRPPTPPKGVFGGMEAELDSESSKSSD